MPESLCLHKSCHCEPAPDSSFCSDICYAAEKSHPQGADCGCGHPECRPENVSPDTPTPS